MKIKNSKFYKPIRIMLADDNNNIVLKDKDSVLAENYPFNGLLSDLLSNIYLDKYGLVIQKEKLRDFVKCTDFYTAEYSENQNTLFESELCYFHPKLEVFILINSDLSADYENQIFEEGLFQIKKVFYDSASPNAKENIDALFNEYFEKYTSKEAKVSILLKTSHGFDLKTHTIKPYRIDLDKMYNDDFMEVHARIKQSITNDSKGIVLLHGIAGSGKTNYIKWLTSQIPNKKFIFVPTTMISYLTDPSFIGLLVENKNSVLVLEDCENYIEERTTLNANTDVVSSILNIADGMLSDILECQLICTFNSDISKIDSALLRKGRLIAEYKFKKLSIQKCNEYLQSEGKDIQVDTEYSIAELTNMDIKELKQQNPPNKIGF